MRKILSFVLVLTLIMAMAIGCTSKDMDYEDGVYSAEGEVDDRGWRPTMTITIKDGRIEEVEYDEVNEEGLYKSEDEEYGESMKGASGVSPEEAYEQLEGVLVSNQDVDKVDAVAGATTSSEQFKELAKEILENQ